MSLYSALIFETGEGNWARFKDTFIVVIKVSENHREGKWIWRRLRFIIYHDISPGI